MAEKPEMRQVNDVLRRARLVLLWEHVWPTLFHIGLLVTLYLALSWLGFWQWVPAFVQALGIVGFVGAFGYYLWDLIRRPLPDEPAAIRRVEDVSGVAHKPLTASLDQPAGHAPDDETTEARLWRAHQLRIAASLARMRAGLPGPQVSALDPYGLRTLVVLLAFIGFNVAGPDRLVRLADIAQFSTPEPVVATRLDAWVTPPGYTGRPPIFLTRDNLDPAAGAVAVPEQSVVTIRVINAATPLVTFTPENAASVAIAALEVDGPQPTSEQLAYEFALSESGSLSVATGGQDENWTFDVVKDLPPEIAFATDPEIQQSGAIQVVAILKDDYGVQRAEGVISPSEEDRLIAESGTVRPLFDAPDFPLSLNRGRVTDGTSNTIRSLVDHPWAGADVTMRLRAVDQAGLEGFSDPVEFTLPMRRFVNPIAKALIEQRRALAMDANYASRLADILDVLTVRPEQFEDNPTLVIALAAVRRETLNARDDEDLRSVVDTLWNIAIGLEDGNLSDAERNLRDALEALREGIENGASEEELARLMQDARQAMREFMQALAERAQQNAQNGENQQPVDPSQTLTPQDLERMLDQIENLAETGSRDAAQQLLSQLQQMMENLQAQQGQQRQQGQSQAQQMLNELGEMIRRQQELMDQTFRQQNQQGQQQGQQGQQGQRGQQQGQQQGQGQGQQQGQGQGGLQDLLRQLENGQQGLADRLREFLDQMAQNGVSPNQQLGDAENSMGRAARDLGEGDLGGAGNEQSDALDQLRQGAQDLANQMAGEGQGEGDHALTQGDRRRDPLGRQESSRGADFGDDVEVPDEIDTQRAREILDAIRRRLGEPLRPQIELEYLERLLRGE